MEGLGYLDNIPLEMETLDDRFDNSIVRYEYPYVDGADLDNLGLKARTIKVRCHFWDEGDHRTYDNHVTLIDYLKKKTGFELLHPEHGLLNVQVESVDIHYDDSESAVTVDISFVEDGFAGTWPAPAADVTSSVESSFLASVDEQLTQAESDLNDTGLDTVQELAEGTPILSQLKRASAYDRQVAGEIDGYITRLNNIGSEIPQPVNSLTATINFATTLPGRLIGTLTRCVERVARTHDALLTNPGRFIASLDAAFTRLIAAADSLSGNRTAAGNAARTILVRHLTIACAQRHGLEAAYCYAEDETSRQLVRRAEKAPSFDSLGRHIAPTAAPPLMNARDLEESLARVRTRLQEGVAVARSLESLKEMALALQEHVSTVKLEVERIVTVEIDGVLPLHILCLRYGLPYNYAERIRTLNPDLANPSFVTGSVRIYALPGVSFPLPLDLRPAPPADTEAAFDEDDGEFLFDELDGVPLFAELGV